MRRLLRRGPRHRRMDYNLRRASRIHPHLALQRNRAGLIQRLLSGLLRYEAAWSVIGYQSIAGAAPISRLKRSRNNLLTLRS